MGKTAKMAIIAWLLVLLYYFYQYALRSAPSVMLPQLTEAFGLNALGVASIVGLFYYGYSPFSLITGIANFINFTFSAIMGQLFGWLLLRVSNGSAQLLIKDYRMTFGPLIFGVALAIFMTFFIKETGHAVMKKTIINN